EWHFFPARFPPPRIPFAALVCRFPLYIVGKLGRLTWWGQSASSPKTYRQTGRLLIISNLQGFFRASLPFIFSLPADWQTGYFSNDCGRLNSGPNNIVFDLHPEVVARVFWSPLNSDSPIHNSVGEK